jgi:ribosomal protein L11 methyltransferase
MPGHKEIMFTDIQPEQQEWVIAHLAEAGYDGFEEGERFLKAYIPIENFDAAFLKDLAFKYQLSFTDQTIPEQNWNKLWESNFQPVIVGNFAAIRAAFHEPIKDVQYEIVITPKMSFGTGHHATTYMMIEQMSRLDLTGKTVFDFGTGTGILAILAEKLGAKQVVAIDNDEWSITNCRENLAANQCKRVVLKKAERIEGDERYDVMLANINKHILVDRFGEMISHTNQTGILILSGLLPGDYVDILSEARKYPEWKHEKTVHNSWLSIRFDH